MHPGRLSKESEKTNKNYMLWIRTVSVDEPFSAVRIYQFQEMVGLKVYSIKILLIIQYIAFLYFLLRSS